MKVTEGKIGRIFILKLEQDDIIPDCIENFSNEKNINVAQVTFLGGVYDGDLVVGPRKTNEMPPNKMTLPIDSAHEVLACGLIAPDKDNKSILHLHGALGRAGNTITGCFREGLKVWLVGEVVINEILGTNAKRLLDKNSGFVLLDI